ncbi:MAG: hypothetical protein OEM99_01090 [Gammaproteobacteria bacterium]|nr:hypothetical protein [Gammaproteobacteria bacterium]
MKAIPRDQSCGFLVLIFFVHVGAQDPIMPEGLLPIIVFIVVVIIYTIAKVIDYSRQSDQQWREVDKSKLREWEDDD